MMDEFALLEIEQRARFLQDAVEDIKFIYRNRDPELKEHEFEAIDNKLERIREDVAMLLAIIRSSRPLSIWPEWAEQPTDATEP